MREMIRVERKGKWFSRPKHALQQAWIFIDVSGSVKSHLPFVTGLIASLDRANLEVRCVCWANTPQEVSLEDVSRGILPKEIGSGTEGEKVAQFIVEHKIAKAIIVTDNIAGQITTRLPNTELHICLFAHGSREEGSFFDRRVVPRGVCHRLEI